MDYVIHPEELEPWNIHPGVEARVVAEGQNMTGLMTVWAPKTSFAVHVHPHEQVGICLQGVSVFTIDGQEYVVRKGDVYRIPSNVPHAERNDGDEPVVYFECFSPVRDDLLRKRFEAKIVQ